MFESIIKELRQECDELHSKLKKCDELKEKVTAERKSRLEIKSLELSQAIDRASLCLDILSYQASLQISEDWRTVKLV